LPDTPRNRLLSFIAKWSPEQLAYERGEKNKQLSPGEMLDERCLIKWETVDPSNDQGITILNIARQLVLHANNGIPPCTLDPFSGGGSIPLECGRLGCEPIANDYNPVAYFILKASCEYPQKYGLPGKRLISRVDFGKQVEEEIDVKNVLVFDTRFWISWVYDRAKGQSNPSLSCGVRS